MSIQACDPFCLIHGLKMSKHECLYCCLCFKPLTVEECNLLPDGKREDVCFSCAKREEVIRTILEAKKNNSLESKNSS